MSLTQTIAQTTWDVIIVGGGNAGLCAAIEARLAGRRVLLLECAPQAYRGGNSRHTRNFRCMHNGPLSYLSESYTEQEYMDDLLRVTKGQTDQVLASVAIRLSATALPWMLEQGVHFQPSLSGTLSLDRTNAFFLGGGKSLVNAYYNRAADLGVEICYQAKVVDLEFDQNRFLAAIVEAGDGDTHSSDVTLRVPGKAVVLASGGFQSNIEWLVRAWGDAARNFLIRGTPYNTGEVLQTMLEQGASSVGDPTQCHAVAIDGRAPKFDGGIVTRLDCVPFSIVVNKNGCRFYDEGEDVWPKRYAIWGRLVAAQPDQVAHAVIDSRSIDLFMPSVFPPVEAHSLAELARKLDIPVNQFESTVAQFNQSCTTGEFKATALDGLSTRELEPAKSNWARPISVAPFYAYTMRPGVTFTYLGLKVDDTARVASLRGYFDNVWAAGEIMAGSILGQGYLAGFGMTIGTVFGRIAGQQAAQHMS